MAESKSHRSDLNRRPLPQNTPPPPEWLAFSGVWRGPDGYASPEQDTKGTPNLPRECHAP